MTRPLTFALLGHPVSHSLSPAMFGAAFEAAGLPHRYERVDVPTPRDFDDALARVRTGDLEGVNVTLPHKRLALERADLAAPSAAGTGAANVLAHAEGARLVAHNTDVEALRGRLPSAIRTGLVLGAGGAALAAIRALALRGAQHIVVTSRSFEHDVRERFDGSPLASAGADLLPWLSALDALAPELDVVVQATSAGVGSHNPQTEAFLDRIPWEKLPATAFAIDLVYGRVPTPFVARAQSRGLRAEDGVAMLVAQAEASFELWLGRASPPGAMRRAVDLARG
ncbi:MAG: shikimate dehydrogenase [Polyangiaceae bacterium]|nr:shikimate dehydrogenase [Polyangiaceae bacterium]